jgi:mannan endo-1,6-alpha-mannosidase
MYVLGVHLLTAIQTNGNETWRERVEGLLNATDIFFDQPNATNIMVEVACENNIGRDVCNNDQLSFKAYLARWMTDTTQLAPFTYNTVKTYLRTSAAAAALQCSGAPTGRVCGFKWPKGADWDGSSGVGQQMCALSVIQGNLVDKVAIPVTADTGGTSRGILSVDNSPESANHILLRPITEADRGGASALTILALVLLFGGATWMVL